MKSTKDGQSQAETLTNLEKNDKYYSDLDKRYEKNPEYLSIIDPLFAKFREKAYVEPEPPKCTCGGELITFNKATKKFEACEACNPRKKCTHCDGTGIRMICWKTNTAYPECICDDTKAKANKLNEAGFNKTILQDENFTLKKPAPFYPVEKIEKNQARKELQDFDKSDKNLLLVTGESLVGKTTQISYMVRDYILNSNKNAKIINLEDVYDAIDARDRNNPVKQIIAEYLHPDLLVIDGVDREQIRRYKFKSLILKRLEEGKKTIIVTTIEEQKFSEFGEAINARIEKFAQIVRLGSATLRPGKHTLLLKEVVNETQFK